jgi:hypothetical protein
MKLDSKYFDSIRVSSGQTRETPKTARVCQWKGCSEPGSHRAPKGRGHDGEYYRFCIDHVRQYNASYNYFEGMSNSEVEDFRKDAITGHRPTWKLGENAWATGKAGRDARSGGSAADPHGLFDDDADIPNRPAAETRRPLRTLERKALDSLHLTEKATAIEIKARFKELVKRHHPDANGGDRGAEDKLREIIQAYNYLKQAGLV